MWLATRYGFFSVTVSNFGSDTGKIQIRARVRKDLEALSLFAADNMYVTLDGGPLADKIIETSDSDYRYRVIVEREEWALLAYALAADLDYTNFKDEIYRDNPDRERIYMTVWGLLRSGLSVEDDNNGS